MPGPGSVASSASSRVNAAAATAAAASGGGGNERRPESKSARPLKVSPPHAVKQHATSDDEDDDGIPLSVLHMISNKDNVRNDVNHAELFAKLREDDEIRRVPPSHNSSASSVRNGDGGGGEDKQHAQRRSDDDKYHSSKRRHHNKKRYAGGHDNKHESADPTLIPDDAGAPLSPRSALRRKGALLQELYMHIGQINSQVNPAGPSAPIQSLDMSATLEEVEIEVERAKVAVGQLRAIKFMRKGLVTIASAAEFTNKRFNPWPLELDGFADFLTSGIGDYDACFAKLYDKYKGRSQEMPPELELLMLLGSSAFMFHLSKSFAKSAMENANFTAAVASAMASQQPQPHQQRASTAPPPPSSSHHGANFNDAASMAGTTVSQQIDESRLVERLKKSKMLPDNVTKLTKA